MGPVTGRAHLGGAGGHRLAQSLLDAQGGLRVGLELRLLPRRLLVLLCNHEAQLLDRDLPLLLQQESVDRDLGREVGRHAEAVLGELLGRRPLLGKLDRDLLPRHLRLELQRLRPGHRVAVARAAARDLAPHRGDERLLGRRDEHGGAHAPGLADRGDHVQPGGDLRGRDAPRRLARQPLQVPLADGVGVAGADDLDLDRLEVELRDGDAQEQPRDREAARRVHHADVHPSEHRHHALGRAHPDVCAAARRGRSSQRAGASAVALLKAGPLSAHLGYPAAGRSCTRTPSAPTSAVAAWRSRCCPAARNQSRPASGC